MKVILLEPHLIPKSAFLSTRPTWTLSLSPSSYLPQQRYLDNLHLYGTESANLQITMQTDIRICLDPQNDTKDQNVFGSSKSIQMLNVFPIWIFATLTLTGIIPQWWYVIRNRYTWDMNWYIWDINRYTWDMNWCIWWDMN